MLYAPRASSEFNARFEAALRALSDDVRAALGDRLVALILGGGYGRGEGAVVHRNGIEMPYNDLDLTLVVRRGRRRFEPKLHEIAQRYASRLGIEIDFSRPLTLEDISAWPCCLMWQDLLARHVTLEGPPNLLSSLAPQTLTAPLPAIEGTRLLLNRGAGVVWSLRVARDLEPPPDADFIRRNYYKCALALGDALLIAHQRFASQYLGRELRLRQLMQTRTVPDVLGLYEAALRFKFCPDDLPPEATGEKEIEALARRWGEVWLHVENHRAGWRWTTLDQYVADRRVREPVQNAVAVWPRNLLLNLRMGRLSLTYPREVLYPWLPRLLCPEARGSPAASTWNADSAAFLRIWKRFN